ncbi:MAG TPA: hypothetical protein VJX70_12145 [Candidatus Acidoferrum sp.]|nr:hypothetical protein [Candidatus Acidoferrum sp.]
MRYTKLGVAVLGFILTAGSGAWAQDPGWPRLLVKPAGKLIVYQPQVDNWNNFTDITWRQAFEFTPTGGSQIVGAASFEGTTEVNTDTHTVFMFNIQTLNTYFPGKDPATSSQLDQLVRSFVPLTYTASLDRLVAYMPQPQSVQTVNLKNDPPFIFVSYSPAILLGVDGEPVLSDIPKTDLKFVVNTTWPLFFDKNNFQYYLLVNNIWMSAGDLHGPWSRVMKLSKAFDKVPADSGKFADVKKAVPPPQVPNAIIPQVFYAAVPAEVILFNGQPTYTAIPGTQLVYANNTDSPVFVYGATQTYYYLVAGRWFSAQSLTGPWTFASLNLPPDFANIPLSNPASAILASVPGTSQAKDAVLIAQIPTTMVLNPTTAAAQAKVSYTGNPQFVPIQGTTMQYATNTPDKVIQVGDLYYLCLQGVWFMSTTPQGPWTTASSVPQVIYTIPPSSPVYNVTYVTQVTTSDGNVQSSYTAGYLGAFVMGAAVGAIMANGSGYYYPPYIGYPAYGYPVYHPYPTCYGAYGAYGTSYYHTSTGAYGVSQTAYGAYGSATRTASYNPYTGTATRTASTSTAYGKQTVGQAYNPYTGSYGATHQGSSPTAQWGSSYVSQGNKSATTQHYTTASGTTASAQGSQGGKAYGSSSAYGNTAAGKTSNGDMYAGHDGNVYKNTGSGWQQSNGSGGWSNVNTTQNQQKAQQNAQSYEQQHPSSQATGQQDKSNYQQQHPSSQASNQSMNQSHSSYGGSSENLDSEKQNRDTGSAQSHNYQSGSHSYGGYGGGGRSWGGGGGGGDGRRR